MWQNEAIQGFENLEQWINPDRINTKFERVISKEDLSWRIAKWKLNAIIETQKRTRVPDHQIKIPSSLRIKWSRVSEQNPHQSSLSNSLEQKWDITNVRQERLNKATIQHLTNLSTWILPIWSPEYNKTMDEVNSIMQKNTLWLNSLIGYSWVSVLSNSKITTIKLNKAGKVWWEGEITLTLNKWSNRYFITKAWKIIWVWEY